MDDRRSLSKSRFHIKYFFVFTGEIKISTNENGKAVFAREVVSTHLKVLHIYRNKRSFTPEGCSMMSLPVMTWKPHQDRPPEDGIPLRIESPSGWNPPQDGVPLRMEPPHDRTPSGQNPLRTEPPQESPSGWNPPQDRIHLMTEPPHDRTPLRV